MALLSSLSLALLKDKKPKGKAPPVPVFGSEIKAASVRTAAHRSSGDHERLGLGALSRCAPLSLGVPGDCARNGGVIVASPTAFPRTSSSSSSASAPPAKPSSPRQVPPQSNKTPDDLQESPSPRSTAAVGNFLAAYSDSDEDDGGSEIKDDEAKKACASVAQSKLTSSPESADGTQKTRHNAQLTGRAGIDLSSQCAVPDDVPDEDYEDEDIDGEELAIEELRPIAHLCGPGAWRWLPSTDKRRSGQGPRLGSHSWTIESTKAEEDPDMEDFAFISEIASIEQELANELGHTHPEKAEIETPPPPPPPDAEPPPEPADKDAVPSPPQHTAVLPIPLESESSEVVLPQPLVDLAQEIVGLSIEANAPNGEKKNVLNELSPAQSELSAGRRIAEQLRQADEPYRREQERRREEERRQAQEDDRRRIEEKRREKEEEKRRAEKRRAKEDDRHSKRTKDEDRCPRGTKLQTTEATRLREDKMRRVESERRQIEESRKLKDEAEQRTAQLEKQQKKAQEDWVNTCSDGSRSEGHPSKRTKSITFGAISTAASVARPNKAEIKEDEVVDSQRQSVARSPPTTLSGLLRQAGQKLVKDESKEGDTVGWLPAGYICGLCDKGVVKNGGVFCGRRRPDKTLVGCFAGVCWKCMSKAPSDKFGGIRTTKAEFTSLGIDAWWMHEGCMAPSDLKDYNGDDENECAKDDVPTKSSSKESTTRKHGKEKQVKTFAWE